MSVAGGQNPTGFGGLRSPDSQPHFGPQQQSQVGSLLYRHSTIRFTAKVVQIDPPESDDEHSSLDSNNAKNKQEEGKAGWSRKSKGERCIPLTLDGVGDEQQNNTPPVGGGSA